jgi:hypothetical protein
LELDCLLDFTALMFFDKRAVFGAGEKFFEASFLLKRNQRNICVGYKNI